MKRGALKMKMAILDGKSLGRKGRSKSRCPIGFQSIAEGVGVGGGVLEPGGALVELLGVGGRSSRDPWLCCGCESGG